MSREKRNFRLKYIQGLIYSFMLWCKMWTAQISLLMFKWMHILKIKNDTGQVCTLFLQIQDMYLQLSRRRGLELLLRLLSFPRDSSCIKVSEAEG